MADLEAQGPDPVHTWRYTIPSTEVSLGRSAAESVWSSPWDRQISRLHASLRWDRGKLQVRRDPQSRNAIYFKGEASDDFQAGVGEHFFIGETKFSVLESEPETDSPAPFSELTCSPQELEQVRYVDFDDRLDALAELPGLIRHSPSDEELEKHVLDVVLKGMPRAGAAAVVWLNPDHAAGSLDVKVRSLSLRGPAAGKFRPSRRLVLEAIRRRRQSVMHLWDGRSDFTLSQGYDWAICVPLPDDPAPGWGLYMSGRLPSEVARAGPSQQDGLKSDLKFAELVANMFGSLRQVRDLQRRQALLARFLSQPVLAAISEKDIEDVLRPREVEVTVLFCDLRGSCNIAEQGQRDLARLCDRINAALSIMTSSIIDQDGVIGDFQGDAAMGFWGWPLPADDQVERAARAALAIRRRFTQASQQPGNPLSGFACGIGIASGPAIAGKLGTLDQFKVSVFGPVVNLAARPESMTKFFQTPILLDEPTAERLAGGRNTHWARCRRIAQVQPYGMSVVLTVSELLPPAVEMGVLSERDRRDYEAAYDAFIAGRWQDARDLLDRMPPDGASDFLKAFMSRQANGPPPGWKGVIALEGK